MDYYFNDYVNAVVKARSYHNGIMQLSERLRIMKKHQEEAQKEADRLKVIYEEQLSKSNVPCTSHTDEHP